MRKKNGTKHALRAGLVAAALCGLSVAHAQTTHPVGADDFGRLMVRQTGVNSVAVGVGTAGKAVASTPSQVLAGVGNWMNYSTWGNGTVANGIRVGQSGMVTIAGKQVPVTVATNVSKAALSDGMGILFRNAAKIAGPFGIVMTLAQFAEMLDQADIKVNPNAENEPDTPFLTDGVRYATPGYSHSNGSAPGPSACPGQGVWQVDGSNTYCGTGSYNGNYSSEVWICLAPGAGYIARREPITRCPAVPGDPLPANWDGVRAKYEAMNPLPSDVLQKQIDLANKQKGQNGIEPYKLSVGPATLSSPLTSVPPETTTERSTKTVPGPDGRPMTVETTTTTTTSRPVSITDDQIKIDPKTTTTTTTKTTDADGVVKETTTTEETESTTDKDPNTDAKPEPQPDLCEKNPDILACSKPELDTPDGEIPRSEREVTYEVEDSGVAGNGSCPANKTLTLSNGQVITAYDWEPACANITTYVRPVVLATAAFIALLILVPAVRSDL